MTDPSLREQTAVSLLQQQASLEANVLAYDNTFMLVAVLAALTVLFIVAAPLIRVIRHQPIGGQAGLIKMGPAS